LSIIKALDNKEKMLGSGLDEIFPTIARSALLSLFCGGQHVTTAADVSSRLLAWGLPPPTTAELDRSDKPGKNGGEQNDSFTTCGS